MTELTSKSMLAQALSPPGSWMTRERPTMLFRPKRFSSLSLKGAELMVSGPCLAVRLPTAHCDLPIQVAAVGLKISHKLLS